MIFRTLLVATLLAGGVLHAPGPCGTAHAEVAVPSARALAETLRVSELMGVLRDEGLAYAKTLDEDLFPGRGGEDWQTKARAVYDRDAMEARFRAAFATAIEGDTAALSVSADFFASPLGQQIVTLELEARRAMMDTAVEDAARARVDVMRAEDDPRLADLQRFVETNDLVEANVQGALNANLAFYRGMVEAGGMDGAVDEQQMLSDVWSQEDDVRAETEVWLYAYLAMAYGGLSKQDMQAYIGFSASAEGQRLNAALFAAFDAVFVSVSRDLGRAAALQMQGQDI